MPATVGLKNPVDYTIVNGKIVVREGKLVNVDEHIVTENANRVVAEYLAKN